MTEEAENNQSVTHEESAQPQSSAETLKADSASDKELNFQKLRQSVEEERKQRQQLEQRLEELTARNDSEEKDELSDDDFVEMKHLKKALGREKESFRKELQDLKSKYEVSSAESKLKSQFPDFDQVVTQENIEKLKQQEPEVAQTLLAGQDLYSKGVSAYKWLKSMGMGPKEKSEEAQKIEENAQKPRMGSQGAREVDRPIQQAYSFSRMSNAEKKRFYEESRSRLAAMKWR